MSQKHFTIVVLVKRYALPQTDLTAKTFTPLTRALMLKKQKAANKEQNPVETVYYQLLSRDL